MQKNYPGRSQGNPPKHDPPEGVSASFFRRMSGLCAGTGARLRGIRFFVGTVQPRPQEGDPSAQQGRTQAEEQCTALRQPQLAQESLLGLYNYKPRSARSNLGRQAADAPNPVSYTHLTLPTT